MSKSSFMFVSVVPCGSKWQWKISYGIDTPAFAWSQHYASKVSARRGAERFVENFHQRMVMVRTPRVSP